MGIKNVQRKLNFLYKGGLLGRDCQISQSISSPNNQQGKARKALQGIKHKCSL